MRLEEGVEVDLEADVVAAVSDVFGRDGVEFRFGEGFAGGDGESRLVEDVEPGVDVRFWNGEVEGVAVRSFGEALKVALDGPAGALEKVLKVGGDVFFPVVAGFGIILEGIAEKAVLSGGGILGVSGWNDGLKDFNEEFVEVGEARFLVVSDFDMHRLVTGFEGCLKEVAVELLDVVFGGLARAGPDDGASDLMDFEHVFAGFFAAESEDALENHGDVGHEVDGIVVDDDVPRRRDLVLFESFGLKRGLSHIWRK